MLESHNPSVSIIICTHGRCQDLQNTLASLQSIRVPEYSSVELLVVENGSKGDAECLVESFTHDRIDARYIFQPESGKSRALNLALAESTGQILLFSDDDIRFPKDWIEKMCEPILSGNADAVAGGVKLAPHLLRPWMNRTHRAWLASTADYLSPDAPSELCGANMAVHRKVLDQVPGFETQLGPGVTGGGEDSLFTWQLKEAGFRIVGAPDIEVEHHLKPDRLLYRCWVNTARLRGRTRAYQMHHWLHQTLSFPEIKSLYFRTKLILRRAFSKKRAPSDEGISPWEMSYLTDIATCDEFMRERRKPRAYSMRGLRKLSEDRHPVTP